MKVIRAHQVFDGRELLAPGTVVVVDGRLITAVQSAEAPLPAGCDVVDFPSGTLLPGLIDAHVHLCADSGLGALDRIPDFSDEEMTGVIEASLQQQLAGGVTAVRDLGDRRYAVVSWRDRTGDDVALPTVVASGPPITTPGGHCWNMGGEAEGVEALRAAVRERAERGVDIVKIMASGGMNTPGSDAAVPQFTAGELTAVVSEAHSLGLPVTAHAHALPAIRSALDAGVDGIEHATFVTQTGVHLDESVVSSLVESGVPVCPTLGVAPGVTPPPAVLEQLRRAGIDIVARGALVAQLHRAGVRLVAGSDGGITPGKPHGILREALIPLVDNGVTAIKVLESATSYGAHVCGLADRTGRVEAGLDADLLVVDGDPFSQIEALRDVHAVFLRGQQVV